MIVTTFYIFSIDDLDIVNNSRLYNTFLNFVVLAIILDDLGPLYKAVVFFISEQIVIVVIFRLLV